MNLKARFSLIGAGMVIFLVATPLLALYALGLTYDFSQHHLVQTGTLVVKTDPTKASVFLNGREQSTTTPLVARFLVPQDYLVRVEKPGYQPWQKRLSVNPQYVTWAAINRDFVSLFYSQPHIQNTYIATHLTFSSNQDEIFFTDDQGQAHSLNVNNGQTATLGSLTKTTFPDLTNPQLQWQGAAKIFEMMISQNRKIIPAALLNQMSFAESDGNRIIFLAGADLYSYDLVNLQLLDQTVSAATLGQDGIWYAQGATLKHLSPNNPQAEILFSNLPAHTTISLLEAQNRIFLRLNDTLYILNETLEPIASPVTFAHWDSVSRQLLYGNANEIQIYNPNTKNSQLILRSISPIANPILNQATGFVFYTQNNQIQAIELDNRQGQNVFTVIKDAGLNPVFTLSPSGRLLYLYRDNKLTEYSIR